MPTLTFPENLPVSAERDRIAAAIRAHPVVIVSGETGSGKTTQLPKICACRPRRQRPDRPHAAAPAGRQFGGATHRRRAGLATG
ncbi:MAG: hypothetical protein R3E68_06940 [Burkholderiaceae bacterium]